MGRGPRGQQARVGIVARNRRHGPLLNADAVLPTEMNDYFAAIEAKHFDKETAVGSRFTDPEITSLRDLVEKAEKMPGGLNRDERALYDKDNLRKDCRYLRVPVQGENGLVSSRDLDDETPVFVKRTKPDTPCSLVVSGQPEKKENFATLIIGPRPNSGGECVWTAHPGPPVKPAQEDIWPEGSEITVKDVRAQIGECFLQLS